MKKNILTTIGVSTILIFFTLLTSLALADGVTVTRNMPGRVDPNGALTVTFSINPSSTQNNFDLAELIPQSWSIKEWSVSGYDKSDITFETQESQTFLGNTYKGYHWKFNKGLSSAVSLSYNLNVPVSSGDYKFVGITTYPGGFNKDEATLTIASAPPTTSPPATQSPSTSTTQPQPQTQQRNMMLIIVVVALIALIAFVVYHQSRKTHHKTTEKSYE